MENKCSKWCSNSKFCSICDFLNVFLCFFCIFYLFSLFFFFLLFCVLHFLTFYVRGRYRGGSAASPPFWDLKPPPLNWKFCATPKICKKLCCSSKNVDFTAISPKILTARAYTLVDFAFKKSRIFSKIVLEISGLWLKKWPWQFVWKRTLSRSGGSGKWRIKMASSDYTVQLSFG